MAAARALDRVRRRSRSDDPTAGAASSGTTLDGLLAAAAARQRLSPRDMLDAEKLAIYEAKGKAAGLAINFISLDEGPTGRRRRRPEPRRSFLRDALADPLVIALIGPARSRTPLAPRSRCSTPPGSSS
jgi:hypothetical protein